MATPLQILQLARAAIESLNKMEGAGPRRDPSRTLVRRTPAETVRRIQEEVERRPKKIKGLTLAKLTQGVDRRTRETSERDNVRVIRAKFSRDRTKAAFETVSTKAGGNTTRYKQTVENRDPEADTFADSRRLVVACDCDYFKYYCDYALWKRWNASDLKFSTEEEPQTRNPMMKPLSCKHLFQCYTVIDRENR